VIFDWNEPVNNGLPITGYEVYIRQFDLSYILDRTVCDGLDLTVITNTECTVPLSDLSSIPYYLQLGHKIYIKVRAINDYGSSDLSEAGISDGMEFVPDAPVNLQDMVHITSDSVIGISWQEGASNGDSPVLDYRVTYDQSTGNYVMLVDGLAQTDYTTDITLLPGQIYKFKVEARNTVGYSELSNELEILVA
jgi:hypothetical protein